MKILKKYKYAILAFIIPIVIFCTFFLLKETLTKGLFSRSDSLEQYWPTYQYLYNVLHGNATFPYTLSKGLGGSMYGAFFYGVSSPINIFIYFFKDIQLFIFLSTMIKIGLAGLTMFILLKYKNKNIKHSLIFSFSYTLSGYIILYGCHIMWLDSLWLAPLVLLGINKFIYHKKQLLYILTLLISLISNYYTGYMITIFSIVYFFYELYISYDGHNFFKENRKKIIQFLITTILIGGEIEG